MANAGPSRDLRAAGYEFDPGRRLAAGRRTRALHRS